ncbi:MAG: hypothetical protein ACRDUY_01730 [Nitriliruptorales bacterium]
MLEDRPARRIAKLTPVGLFVIAWTMTGAPLIAAADDPVHDQTLDAGPFVLRLDWTTGDLDLVPRESVIDVRTAEVTPDGRLESTSEYSFSGTNLTRTILGEATVLDEPDAVRFVLFLSPLTSNSQADTPVERRVPFTSYFSTEETTTLFWEPDVTPIPGWDMLVDGVPIGVTGTGNHVQIESPDTAELVQIRFIMEPEAEWDPNSNSTLDTVPSESLSDDPDGTDPIGTMFSNVRVVAPDAASTFDWEAFDSSSETTEPSSGADRTVAHGQDANLLANQALVGPSPLKSRITHKAFIAAERLPAWPLCADDQLVWGRGDNRVFAIDDPRYRTRWYREFQWSHGTNHEDHTLGVSVLEKLNPTTATWSFYDSAPGVDGGIGGNYRRSDFYFEGALIDRGYTFWMKHRAWSAFCPSTFDIDAEIIDGSLILRNNGYVILGIHDRFPSYEVYRLDYFSSGRTGSFVHARPEVHPACLAEVVVGGVEGGCPDDAWASSGPSTVDAP